MRRSNRLVLLIGVFLAALVFILILSGTIGGGGTGTPGASATPGPQAVVVAAVDIPLGALLKADMLTVKTVPANAVLPGAFADPTQLIGKPAQGELLTGKQIVPADVTPPAASEGLKSVEVPPGKRAIAVQVDQISGVGTIIRKGDYVDAIFIVDFNVTQVDQATGLVVLAEGVGINGTSVKLLLQSMQVLGTLLPPVPQASGAPAGDTGATLNGQQEIVILAVDPQQAEVLRFALTGTPPAPITLVLRSKADFVDADGNPTIPPDVTTTGIVLKSLISDYGVLAPEVQQLLLPSPTPR